jgi:DNA repair protein RecO (recombination protein O)
VERGGLVCTSCGDRQRDLEAEPLSIGAARTLEWISSSRPADWPRLSLEPEMRRQLGRIVDRFVAYHLGLRWEHGMYRKI